MKLRDYQEDISDKACDLLNKYKIAYLAMQVRTGKTLTSLATAKKYGAKSVLFVTKKKAIGDIESQAIDYGFKFDDLNVTNYEQLHHVKSKFDIVIVDEAHSIGAFPLPSNRAIELKRICKDTPIILLSGTPTPESYSQIYHQFWISSWSPFAEYNKFYAWAHTFVNIGRIYVFNRTINDYKNAKLEMIEPIISKYFITYTQEQAGFESKINEHVLLVKMEENTYKMAEWLKTKRIAKNKDGEIILADTEVKLMNKLHQIFSGTVILDEPGGSAKVLDDTKAKYIKKKFEGKKIAIFYKFRAEYNMLLWEFGANVTDDPVLFNESSDLVYLGQIQSSREGINLSTADALIFMNIDFSAVSYWQSRARIQTKDRTKESNIFYVFADGGIENKIMKAVINKKDYTLSHFKNDYL